MKRRDFIQAAALTGASLLALGTSDAWTESIRELRARRSAGELQAPYIYGTGGHLTLQGTHPIYTIFPPAVWVATDSLAAETPHTLAGNGDRRWASHRSCFIAHAHKSMT